MQVLVLASMFAISAAAQSILGSSTSLPPPTITAPARCTATTMTKETATGNALVPVTTVYGLDFFGDDFEGSVSSADQASTTVVATCQPEYATVSVGKSRCAEQLPLTITYGSGATEWQISTNTALGVKYTATMSERCELQGSDAMACTIYYSKNFPPNPPVTDGEYTIYDNYTSTVYTDHWSSSLPSNRLTLTAGVEKLSATASTATRTTASAGSFTTSTTSTTPAAPRNATARSAARRTTVMGSNAETGVVAAFCGIAGLTAVLAYVLEIPYIPVHVLP